MEREVRFIPVESLEVRADDEGTPKGIEGTAAVYEQSTIISGMFEERIAPGAFDDVLESDDVRALFNHDPNYPLGRTSAKTLELRSDEDALHYEVPELPKSRADVLEAIQRGDVTGNSFSFSVTSDDDEEWTDRSEEGKLPLRIIKRVGKLYDVGPVTFPAYEETQVSARSQERAAKMTEREAEGADNEAAEWAERERLRLADAENVLP